MNVQKVLNLVPVDNRGAVAAALAEMFEELARDVTANATHFMSNLPEVQTLDVKHISTQRQRAILRMLQKNFTTIATYDVHLCIKLENMASGRVITYTECEQFKYAIKRMMNKLMPEQIANRSWCIQTLDDFGLNFALALNQPDVRAMLLDMQNRATLANSSVGKMFDLGPYNNIMTSVAISGALILLADARKAAVKFTRTVTVESEDEQPISSVSLCAALKLNSASSKTAVASAIANAYRSAVINKTLENLE